MKKHQIFLWYNSANKLKHKIQHPLVKFFGLWWIKICSLTDAQEPCTCLPHFFYFFIFSLFWRMCWWCGGAHLFEPSHRILDYGKRMWQMVTKWERLDLEECALRCRFSDRTAEAEYKIWISLNYFYLPREWFHVTVYFCSTKVQLPQLKGCI